MTWSNNDRRTRIQINHMLVRSHWASSMINSRDQISSEHGSDHAVFRTRLRLHLKAARLSNRPDKLNSARLKTAVLGDLRLELRNHFEDLGVEGDASLEYEWRRSGVNSTCPKPPAAEEAKNEDKTKRSRLGGHSRMHWNRSCAGQDEKQRRANRDSRRAAGGEQVKTLVPKQIFVEDR